MRENPQEEGLVEMGGRSLYSVMDRCRNGDEGRHRAKSIFELASLILAHSKVENLPIYELKMALASALTLIGCHDGALEEEQYGNLLYWAADLCNKPHILRPNWSNFIDADPYLLFMIIHWPTPNRQSLEHQCMPEDLKKMVALLQEAFERLQAKSPRRRNIDPFFFLTNRPNVQSVISKFQLSLQAQSGRRGRICHKVSVLLQSRAASELIQRFDGFLSKDGKEVRMVVSRDDVKTDVNVPVLIGERKQLLWNKRVSFALGFGVKGPVACDIRAIPA
jgi:hypothetical protein